MSKQAARNINIAVNSVALEDDINDASLEISQETPVVTSFADAGPRRLAANYDYSANLGGVADFASGQSDATLFAMLGSAGVVLESYSISGAVGGAVEFSASLQGNSAIARAVA